MESLGNQVGQSTPQEVKWEIGDRVLDEQGYRGTVRYIGPVCTSKKQDQTWIGVEWDTSGRGKHNGSVESEDGKIETYFTCEANMGSFLKPHKLDKGTDFVVALRERYVREDAPLVAPNQKFNEEEVFVMTSGGLKKPIELLGEEKVRKKQQLELIDKVTMRDDRVSTSGENILETIPRVTKIDLQRNLLSDWNEIANICHQLPQLKYLNISWNRLQPTPQIFDEKFNSAFQNLETIVLTSCDIKTWKDINSLSNFLPQLKELYIANNQFNDIHEIEFSKLEEDKKESEIEESNLSFKYFTCAANISFKNNFANVNLIDLTSCKLSSWGKQIISFSFLQNLETLLVSDNEILEILPCFQIDQNVSFPKLEMLSISANKISDWSSIDAISTFPSLFTLRFSHNPIVDDKSSAEARLTIIARIGKLKRLNGSDVNEKERMDSEKLYLLKILRQVSELDQNNKVELMDEKKQVILAQHPRFQELLEKWGNLITPASNQAGTGSLASEMINVTLISLATSNITLEPISKRIPGSMTVEKLKILCKKMFKIDPDLQILYYRTDKYTPPVPLDDETSPITFMGVTNGCEILVNEVDEFEKKKEEEKMIKQEKEREEKQRVKIEALHNYKRSEISRETASVAKQVESDSIYF